MFFVKKNPEVGRISEAIQFLINEYLSSTDINNLTESFRNLKISER